MKPYKSDSWQQNYYIKGGVKFQNLLTAMIKSWWSLKVIKGSERHLVERKRTVRIYLVLVNAATFLCESLTMQHHSPFKKAIRSHVKWRHTACGGGCWWGGDLTWSNSSDHWWWFCCPTSLDPSPYPLLPWMLLEINCTFRSPQPDRIDKCKRLFQKSQKYIYVPHTDKLHTLLENAAISYLNLWNNWKLYYWII